MGEAVGLSPLRVADLKTVVSEACNNVVLHAYEGEPGPLEVTAEPRDGELEIQVAGMDGDGLAAVADEVKRRLSSYEGVFGVRDSRRWGQEQVQLSILPSAEALGLSLYDLGRQVRQAFYGEGVQRVQRGQEARMV